MFVFFFLFFLLNLREELGKNINADEAAAMGAVYQAAALSKAFKVKPFLVRDAAVFPIQVRRRRAGGVRFPVSDLFKTRYPLISPGGLHPRDGGGGGHQDRETQQAHPV